MSPIRRVALIAGVLYLVTFVASIPAVILLNPVLNHSDYILGSGSDNRVILGCVLDVINALAGVGTAVVLFPVAKRQSEARALGFVTTRVMEAAIIFSGIVALMAIVTVRQDVAGRAGADTGSLVTSGQALVALRDWTVLLGPGLMPALSALLIGSVMYQSRLVPRIIPTMGLIGSPLLLISVLCTMFGVFDQFSPAAFFLALLIALWELTFGLWMTFKGFNPSPLTADMASPPAPPAVLPGELPEARPEPMPVG
ncbi:DUF4386 domain-containing protein [Angustibacter luteus]|uniref:DUF4386 domain-containing protein n=1 Tax=Angustibacter luteus TaxID=658456 RepID=A0ABW1JGG9_9ACTN